MRRTANSSLKPGRKYSIGLPCSLYPGMPYPLPPPALLIAVPTCSSFGRTHLGLCGNVLVKRLGNTLFHTPHSMFRHAFFSSPIYVWRSTSSGLPSHTAALLLFIELCCMNDVCGPPRTIKRLPTEVHAGILARNGLPETCRCLGCCCHEAGRRRSRCQSIATSGGWENCGPHDTIKVSPLPEGFQ
jgi:hypothetical protein